MKLQLALDIEDKKKALSLCEKTKKYIDIIELGTPFIKIHGLKSIKDFKKHKKEILADLKTMDTGYFEAELAYQHGADFSTVCASSFIDTVKGSIKASKDYKKKILVDLIACENVLKKTKEIIKYKPDFIGIHSGIDMQNKGITPYKELKKISSVVPSKKLAVAGGINIDTIEDICKIKPGIIIVGGAVTKAKNPKQVVKKIKEIMNKYENK